ncbi:hypothetical protein CEN48_18825 [Fischerella thermalis CCMEE 5282]|uniref:nSTAND1 domain-containing NTPase n=1 Tax=Fischerella thermalis TaxID=372787 RepID=UPI000C7FC1F6|nr:hypothetical protein [Fischerella thermalis]PMB11914.1 hypothetical protein CEN48_18825 [Fischerella thermalis CCMEE 5282]
MQYSPEVENKTNNKTFSEEKSFLKLAQDHYLSAEAALAKNNWYDAKSLAQTALEFLDSHQNREHWQQNSLPTPSTLTGYLFLKISCLFILAQAQEQLNEIPAAIRNLEAAKQIGITDNNPYLYISILNSLQRLYKQQKQYLEAFSTKLEQRSVEQKYGLRAFIGAGSLAATEQAKFIPIGTQLIPQKENIAPEITASSRQKDVEQLLERISSEDYKLIIIYGKSGVGKSSLLNAGLIPALKKKAIATQDNLVVSIQVYDHWIEELAHHLEQKVGELEIKEDAHTQKFTDTENTDNRKNNNLSSELETSTLEFEISALELETPTSKLNTSTLEVDTLALELATLTSELEMLTSEFETLTSELEIIPEPQTFSFSSSPTLPKFHFLLEQLHYNHQQNLRTVLIFDQFEEFFLIHTQPEQRQQFFEFLGECLNISSVKVILSLRENYLHHLLAFNDLPCMEIINNDILSKNILYKLGNLTPADAKTVLMYEGNKYMKQGKIKQAVIAYTNAQNLDPKVDISADAWRELCLQGSLKKQAADVIPACEKAVQLAANNQKIRVVRGVARALTRNKQGAIEDFEAYIAATDSKTGKLKVRRWIEDLRTGRNPFTDKKLKRLLGENTRVTSNVN